MIKGVIFDFDGLILDTETHHYRILQEMFRAHGAEMPLHRWQQEIGTQSDFSTFGYLQEQLSRKIDQEKLKLKLEEQFHETLVEEEAREGVEDYLKRAKELGLKIGLASSSDYSWVSKYLRNLGLFKYFECIKTSDDVEKVKPDPALYLQAAQCLGLQPDQCLVFEDSANGALAAKRAGMGCVIVPNTVTHTMDFCEVEYRLSSMSDMPLKDVIEHVNSLKISK